jgi:CBS-domain-containing membrane protein
MASVLAKDLMTQDVALVGSDTTTREIAQLLLERAISAVPVVDPSGAPIGMVSEGDLIGRSEIERPSRRDWWLEAFAEGEAVNPNFLASLNPQQHTTPPACLTLFRSPVFALARLISGYTS